MTKHRSDKIGRVKASARYKIDGFGNRRTVRRLHRWGLRQQARLQSFYVQRLPQPYPRAPLTVLVDEDDTRAFEGALDPRHRLR